MSGRYWKVVNPDVKNSLGQSVAYKIMPGENILRQDMAYFMLLSARHTIMVRLILQSQCPRYLCFSSLPRISLFGLKILDVYGYLGTIATYYGFLVTYILISIAAPMYLYREGILKVMDVAIAIVAVLFMLVPVVGSLYPVLASPFNVFPYLFLMYPVVGGGWFLMLRLHSPEIIENMELELEKIHTKFNEMKKV